MMRLQHLVPKIKDCRYGEVLEGLIGEYSEILLYFGCADYQGDVAVGWEDENKYYFYEYSYGSCSGCDEWESRSLSSLEIAKEMMEGTVKFENKKQAFEFFNNYKRYEHDNVKKFYVAEKE